MPVRIGFPTGVRGITQLVHGPQYATGVGLVRYGAQAIADAHARAAAPGAFDDAHDRAAAKREEAAEPLEGRRGSEVVEALGVAEGRFLIVLGP